MRILEAGTTNISFATRLLLAVVVLALWTAVYGRPLDGQRDFEAGRYAYLRKDLKTAEKHFRAAALANPESYMARLYLGHSLFYQKKYSDAVPSYEKAMELSGRPPGVPQREERMLTDQLGMAYGLSRQTEKAKALFEAGIKKDPAYPLYYYNLACVFADTADLDGVILNLREAVKRKGGIPSGETFPNPREDDSFKRYLGNEKFEAALKEMGY